MKYRMNLGVPAAILTLSLLSSCNSSDSSSVLEDESGGSTFAAYSQSGDSVINRQQKFYTSENDKNCIYLTSGAELILSESEAASGGSSYDPEGGLAAAVRVNGSGRAILESCKISSFGDGAQALFADNAELIMSGGAAFTNGESSDTAAARNSGSLSFDGVKLNAYGMSSNVIDISDSKAEVKASTVNASGGDSCALRQSGGSSELTDSELFADKSAAVIIDAGSSSMHGVKLRSPLFAALEMNAGNMELVGGSAEYGEVFAKLSGDFVLTIDSMEFPLTDKPFLNITKAPKSMVSLKNTHALGAITTDGESRVKLEMSSASFNGAINPDSENVTVTLSMDSTSSWSVSGTSYIAALMTDTLINIDSNGFNVYYSQADSNNEWLGGKTYELTGGGSLIPR